MSGTFTIGEKKVRPGVYYRYENAGGVTTAGAINGIQAVVFQSNWGPLNEEFDMDVSMANNLGDYYGSGSGVKALEQAFKGGATTVRAVRVGTDSGTKSYIVLKNTAETPADAVRVEAAYVGNRPFTVSVRTNLITGQRQFTIYDGEEIFEQVTFEAGENEPQALVNALSKSKNFKAALVTTGVTGTLANLTQEAMTAGTNPTVTTNSYAKGTDALERYKWNCLTCDSDDAAVHILLQSFAESSYQTGHLGQICIAGTQSQDLTERMTTAASYNDEKVVYVPSGWLGSDGVEYEGYLAANRLGGMIAAFESNTSLTHTVIANAVSLLEPMTNGEIIRAEQKGCLVLSVNDEDQVWIDNAINTLVTPDANQDEGWKKIRRTKTRFELMDRLDTTCEKMVGKVNNDTDGRQTIMACGQKVLNEMIAEKKLMPGAAVYEDEGHPAEGDSCWFIVQADDIDSAEHIYFTYRFRYSQIS